MTNSGILRLNWKGGKPLWNNHLGNPLFLDNNRRKNFEKIIDSVELSSWQWSLLLRAWRTNFIESVVSWIRFYAMSTMKIHVKMVVFESNWPYLVSWDSICRPKYVWGLGFKKIAYMNLLLLSKPGWIAAAKVDKPWVNILLSKHCRFSGFLNCFESPKDSPT